MRQGIVAPPIQTGPVVQAGVFSRLSLQQIIYSSKPFGYDEALLKGVLLDARRCNERDGITGALICRQDIYLQLLEGPANKVRDAFERIKRDDRHLDIVLRVSRSVSGRMFGDWTMLHDPARSWLWTPEDISNGVLDQASTDDIKDVFAVLEGNLRPERG